MPERWLGVTVSSDKVILVDAVVPDSGAVIIQADQSWPVQTGDRPSAYHVMRQQISNYVQENAIVRVVVKSSALSLGGTKQAHLEAAELRGVVLCAAKEAGAIVQAIAKAHISRNFGSRKVDEYIKDGDFWANETTGKSLRAGSREAAMMLLAARSER